MVVVVAVAVVAAVSVVVFVVVAVVVVAVVVVIVALALRTSLLGASGPEPPSALESEKSSKNLKLSFHILFGLLA